MRCSDYLPGNCPGFLAGLYSQWARHGGQTLIWRCPVCGRSNSPSTAVRGAECEVRGAEQTIPTPHSALRTPHDSEDPEQQTVPEIRQMKLKLCVHRKASVEGSYGSEGPGAELELDIADSSTAQQILDLAVGHYHTLEVAVDQQLAKMVARTEAALAARKKAVEEKTRREMAEQRRQEQDQQQPPPRTSHLAPRTRAQPEPGWDADDEPEQQYQPPPRQSAPPPAANGYGGRQQQRGPDNGRSYGPPANGRQLMAAAGKFGMIEPLKQIAKNCDRGMIQDWDADMVAWAWTELQRKQQPAGQWGRN